MPKDKKKPRRKRRISRRILQLINVGAAVVLAGAAVAGIFIGLPKATEAINVAIGQAAEEPPEVLGLPEPAASADTVTSEAPQIRHRSSRPLRVYLNRAATVNYVNVFHDPDGDQLTLTAKSEDEAILSIDSSDSFIVTLHGKKVGTTFVTVTATDPSGKNVWISTRVEVLPVGIIRLYSTPGFELTPELMLYGLRGHLAAGIPLLDVPEKFLAVMEIVVDGAPEATATYKRCFVRALGFPEIETIIGDLLSVGVVHRPSDLGSYILTISGRAVLDMLDGADTVAHDRRLAAIRVAALRCPREPDGVAA